ncbi:hypothetical protein MSAN_00459100 [Mycena sanguinolenta]|uniref:Uncharacterized protein n=1 Tax=Mycena sanguinolenta TaxID=230812 RepID=A0A8H6ZE24_9AGAR|nr:hypothetical protein MSAN_00459100 [Mycena sanguinolenta]
MGQNWKLINLDKQETYGFWGELSDCLFNGSPSCLIQSLMVALSLPDCDKLLFPFTPGALCDDADEFLGCRATYYPQPAVQRSGFVKLSVELMRNIHSELDNIRDVFCLSITCQILWDFGRWEIYRRLALLIPARSWAGDRIICVGDHPQNSDIPEHILTPAEKDEFARAHYTLSSYPFPRISRSDATFDMHAFLMQSNLPFLFSRDLRSLVDLEYRIAPPVDLESEAVLRNLSRHLYVRESALTRWQARTAMAGLGEVVLSQICFSSDPAVGMPWTTGIHQGVWAGDRFDIVSSGWLETLEDAGESVWTDVSGEVVQKVAAIWRQS